MPNDRRTIWQKDVTARREIRAIIDDLYKQAKALRDPSEQFLNEALVHAKSRRLDLAQHADFDLSYAADQCSDPELCGRITQAREKLQALVY